MGVSDYEPADGIDAERLAELRALDEPGDAFSYVDRAIGNFVGSADEQVEAMDAAVAAGDTAGLQALAHRMAGTALNIGAVAIGELLREVEEHLMEGSVPEALARLGEVSDRLPADLEALRAYQRV